MPAKIISAFPACGKSTYYKQWSQYSPENVWRSENGGKQVYQYFNPTVPVGDKIIDADSSLFHWVYDAFGNNTHLPNLNFPNNYIEYIKEHIDIEDAIFVSSHKVVRDALRQNNIPYTLIYPDSSMKDIWLDRLIGRGDDPDFIEFINNHWDEFINEMNHETYPEKIILKNSSEVIDVTLMNGILDNMEC